MKDLMTVAEAADYLGLKKNTLDNWRCTQRCALPFVRLGRRAIRYRRSDLDAFVERGRAGSGTDPDKN